MWFLIRSFKLEQSFETQVEDSCSRMQTEVQWLSPCLSLPNHTAQFYTVVLIIDLGS